MNKRYNLFQKIVSGLLSLVMVLGLMPMIVPTATAAAATPNYITGSKKADPSTIDWEDYFGPDKLDTELAGAVWSDKSVFTGETDELPGITLKDKDNFLIALSAMASNMTITGHASAPTDTMLVLDLSGSMVDDTYEVGTIRQGNRYTTANGIDTAIIEALVDSTNSVIKSLMAQNDNNRVGVVLYSGNTSTDQAATSGSATVVLPLGRYAGVDGEYLSLSAPTTSAALYEYSNRRWQATGETATYVSEGATITVSVKEGLKTEAGANVASASKTVVGGTYIQNGLYKAMNEFLAVSDTTVPAGKVNAGAERLPVIVLMSDGAPTIATTDYTSIGNSNTGNGGSTNDRITFLTQLTAAYVRGKVAEKYKENENDEAEALFLTLGLGTENSIDATNTLYPAGNGETLQDYWNNYLAAANGATVDVISGDGTLNVVRDSAVEAMNYVDKYFYASNAQSLIDTFEAIVSEIELKSATYATLVTGGNADLSGYVTFEDELGELMEVHDMKGILLGDNHFSGIEIAKDMNTGVLGTGTTPTELGNELIRTIKERIPGTTTTQAQQLVQAAYSDKQLYYESDSAWNNYIGWYADADGNYVGFWDKDSGYENAPAGAVYANKSYGYLGVNGDSNMMHVVVMVRTNLTTLHQSVYFKVPASLLPTVTYKVTLAENDPTQVESFVRTGADPIQLVFEVGLRSDINAVNLEAKVAEHIAGGGHIHRNADGSIDLYTNSWAIGNDLNNNGVPDPEEVDSAVVAESHFHPALENSRYYFTEDALVLDEGGNPVTGDTQPSGSGYHHDYYIYSPNGRTTVERTLSATTLSKTQKNAQGQWYVPAGTAYRELPRMRNYKTENVTGTLDYSDYPAIFADENIDVYSFLGNNGTVTIAPATGFALTKQVDGTIENVSTYTFRVTLTNIPDGTTAAPVLTDANGDTLAGVSMSAYANGTFTVTMPADVTAYVSGIPVGTTVTIEEIIDGDYKVAGISVAGAAQTGSAVFTVPAYGANTAQMVPVTFTNAPNTYGDLVITKDVTHTLASDPAALAGKEFTFRVKLTGSKIAQGMTFSTSAGKDVTVGADGYLTYTDGSAIVVHNEESVTIYHIPEGSAYTVTEEAIPGFALESINGEAVTQVSGVISSDAQKVAAFINRYDDDFTPVEVPFQVDVSKVLTELSAYTGNEQFVFVLQMLLPDGTYPNMEADNGEEYLKVSKNSTETGAWTLTFDEIGTYYFRMVELKPSQQESAGTDTPGMDYSTQRALFEVNVTDEDMDGVLEIAVKEEAHITVSGAYTDNDPEKITGITAETTFTNIYELGSTNTSVNVHKTLNNNTGVDKHLTDFQFTLTPSDAQGNPVQGAQSQSVTTSALGDATFNLFLDEIGTFYYKIEEVIPAGAVLDANSGKYKLNGMYYDATAYLLTVVTSPDPDGNLMVTGRTLTNLATGSDVASLTAAFVNDYILTETDPVQIELEKALTGRAPYAGEGYQFYLTRTDDTFHELTGDGRWIAYYTVAANGSVVIRDLTFDKAGSYHYKLTEVIPDDAVALNTGFAPGSTQYVKDGVVYDNAEYHITITVTDNGNGGLAASMVMHKLGETDPADTAAFTNVYDITGSGSVVISGLKVLNGRALLPGEFSFGLYDNAQCEGTPIATVSNAADGTFAFPELEYTVDSLGANNAAKVYTYYIKEIPGNKGGVTYNTDVFTVTVTVSHENGVLTVTPSDNYNGLSIVNTYEATGVDVELSGSKVLSGDWTNVPGANKQFTFELYQTGADFLISGAPIDTVTVDGSGSFSFDLQYNDGEEGYYYYVLKEDTSLQAGGIGYDAGEYHITVNVSDPGNGELMATVSMYRPGTGNTDSAVFTNGYTAAPTELTLTGSKTYLDISTNAGKAMTEGQFQFLVLEGDKVVATGYNLVDGTIEFTAIRYTAAGTHSYSVIEVNDGDGGVTYDDTAFTVEVTVVDDGQGNLSAQASYGEPIVFENTYDPGATYIELEGEKILHGADQLSGEFYFEVLENGQQVATGTNYSDGSVLFGAIDYTAAGTHTYTLREIPGENPGMTYDDTEFTVVVTVVDNGDGTMTATADYGSEPVVWENTYTTTDAQLTLEGSKELTGRDQAEGEFTFEVWEGRILVATGTNAADGTIRFDAITYTAPGEHTYTVSERPGNAGGVVYDNTLFTVTVTVIDNGLGALVATADYGNSAIVFTNTYDPAAVNVTLKGNKTLEGRELEDSEFVFQILSGEEVVATGTNAADGTITFQSIGFTETGVYDFTVQEVKGNADYVIYDNSSYSFTVTVTDDGSGQLAAVVTQNGSEVTDGIVASFQNTYAPPAGPVTGDSFNLTLMTALTAISGAAVIFLAVLLIMDSKKKALGN